MARRADLTLACRHHGRLFCNRPRRHLFYIISSAAGMCPSQAPCFGSAHDHPDAVAMPRLLSA
eukprot:scaffold25360_cov59-Phaeocystis_antarctica.AAC.4